MFDRIFDSAIFGETKRTRKQVPAQSLVQITRQRTGQLFDRSIAAGMGNTDISPTGVIDKRHLEIGRRLSGFTPGDGDLLDSHRPVR